MLALFEVIVIFVGVLIHIGFKINIIKKLYVYSFFDRWNREIEIFYNENASVLIREWVWQ